MSLRSVNPATGALLREWPEDSPADVERRLAAAEAASADWAIAPFADRAAPLRAAAAALRQRADALARLMASEMGKPLPQGRAETEKCAWVCDWYAREAERFLAPEPAAVEGGDAFVAFRPLGTVLGIMPWNFPLWQVIRFAAPALMAGNAVLVKHAPSVQGCAGAIDDVFRGAGLPEGLFASLRISEARTEAVLRDPRVAAVTLTGSPRAGRAVAAIAGSELKKSVLELGGSDPYVVLEDADVEAAAEACVTSRLINGGQSCVSAKRFVVVAPLVDRFTELVTERMKAKVPGDPLGGADPDLGPLARADLRDALHDQVRRTVAAGARLLLGGKVPERAGAWYPPTVLAAVPEGSPAHVEETFGPVAAVVPARDEDDAVRLANASPYGLGAAVFTRDRARGERIAVERLQAGCCFVNDFVRSDPRLPFGGIKHSGYGRELSAFGIREFVNVKAVFVKR
jgi:succinate-semialdehyde dehydrogenase/glutarate-semialdehyde dehydrogenase